MALKCNIYHIPDRINLALKIGWTIDENNFLHPPKHFECSEYTPIWRQHSLEHGNIMIPHYFEDDYIMTTGSWSKSL